MDVTTVVPVTLMAIYSSVKRTCDDWVSEGLCVWNECETDSQI